MWMPINKGSIKNIARLFFALPDISSTGQEIPSNFGSTQEKVGKRFPRYLLYIYILYCNGSSYNISMSIIAGLLLMTRISRQAHFWRLHGQANRPNLHHWTIASGSPLMMSQCPELKD